MRNLAINCVFSILTEIVYIMMALDRQNQWITAIAVVQGINALIQTICFIMSYYEIRVRGLNNNVEKEGKARAE